MQEKKHLFLHFQKVISPLSLQFPGMRATRLGEPSITVRLAKWQHGRLLPWIDYGEKSWHLSEVTVRTALIDKEAEIQDSEPKEAIRQTKQRWPNNGKYHVLIALTPNPTENNCIWTGSAINADGKLVTVSYSDRLGLIVSKSEGENK